MATDTYLEMVSDMIVETGLNSGTAPATIAGATGDAAKVAYWIRVADLRIQRERIDWGFLWVMTDATPLTQDSNAILLPQVNELSPQDATATSLTYTINKVVRNTLAILNSNGESYFPCFMPWNDFSVAYLYDTQTGSDYPAHWSINPTKQGLYLSNPIASDGITYRMQYYRTPVRLRNDTDTSPIPDDFNRLIIVLAKILYAEHEDAPEVSAGAHEEYEHMYNQMLSVWSPDNEWQHMDADLPITVETRL